MSVLKTYRLFISHAWEYDYDYYRLINMLDKADSFKWYNYSVPQHSPKNANSKSDVRQALRHQMRPTNCVLIISGMYVAHREWIQYELKLATEWGKPIIGVKPRASQLVPHEVSSVANTMVGWSTSSIISAIQNHAQ